MSDDQTPNSDSSDFAQATYVDEDPFDEADLALLAAYVDDPADSRTRRAVAIHVRRSRAAVEMLLTLGVTTPVEGDLGASKAIPRADYSVADRPSDARAWTWRIASSALAASMLAAIIYLGIGWRCADSEHIALATEIRKLRQDAVPDDKTEALLLEIFALKQNVVAERSPVLPPIIGGIYDVEFFRQSFEPLLSGSRSRQEKPTDPSALKNAVEAARKASVRAAESDPDRRLQYELSDLGLFIMQNDRNAAEGRIDELRATYGDLEELKIAEAAMLIRQAREKIPSEANESFHEAEKILLSLKQSPPTLLNLAQLYIIQERPNDAKQAIEAFLLHEQDPKIVNWLKRDFAIDNRRRNQ